MAGVGDVTQPTLFDPAVGLVGHTHPDTSHTAARSVMPRTGTQRRRVLDFIARRGRLGATDLEVQEALGMNGNTERPRRVELVDAGLITDSGRRATVHGHPMIVWVATVDGFDR